MRAFSLLALGSALFSMAAQTPAQEPVSLAELAKIARARFEQLRPGQLEALKPYLDDLELSYNSQNRSYLDKRFASAAALGDAIVPALLEKLTPAEAGDISARNVAENSARILKLMDPSGFVNALMDVALGPDAMARLLAIQLLGLTKSRAAAAMLTRLLGEQPATHRIIAVRALTNLRAAGASNIIVTYLGSQDARLREAALGYLAATRDPTVLPTVLQALETKQSPEHLALFMHYLVGAAPRNAEVANALVPMMSPSSDREQLLLVSQALATVAPQAHKPSIAACKAILQLEETGSLGRSCAGTMDALGDRSGLEMLLGNLKNRIAREPKNEIHYFHRAEVYRELGKWAAAVRDYEDAIERTGNRRWKSDLYLLIARSEAHRQRWNAVLKALRDSGASGDEIQRAADEDEALEKALARRQIRNYVDSLGANGGRSPRRRNGRSP